MKSRTTSTQNAGDVGRASSKERPADHDALADYPIGPDELGNAVMHGFAFLERSWLWVARRLRR